MGDADNTTAEKKVLVQLLTPASAERQRWAEPLVARLAAEAWRLRRRLIRVEEQRAGDDVLRPLRESMSRIEDVLAEFKVQMLEHEGESYDPGLQIEVLHAREGEGPTVIVETIRPTILLDGRVLQHGQVVIGPSERDTT
jgi:hypothetical protein